MGKLHRGTGVRKTANSWEVESQIDSNLRQDLRGQVEPHPLSIAKPISLGVEERISVSSTVPRTTRSRVP
jgi:hypothetical protein